MRWERSRYGDVVEYGPGLGHVGQEINDIVIMVVITQNDDS